MNRTQVQPSKEQVERCIRRIAQDFPGGTVVKNPLANAGDMGSSPGLGRSSFKLCWKMYLLESGLII